MRGDEARDKGTLDSALLFLSRDSQCLAAVLERFLPPATLLELARISGRRKPGNHPPALQVAEILGQHQKLRRATVQILLDALPRDPAAGDFASDQAETKAPEVLCSALAFDLLQADAEAWERVQQRITSWQGFLPIMEDPKVAPATSPNTSSTSEVAAAAVDDGPHKESALKQQLRDARHETSRLEEELGREHRRRAELEDQLAEAQAERREAETRASQLKKKLVVSTEASEREQVLAKQAADAHQRQYVAEQKMDLLAWERDDLRACLKDRDLFDAFVEEEVPSFRKRPLLDKEVQLSTRIAAAGQTLRILVVGGGEPQFRHRDKLVEYAEVMGFASSWRMAEYISWHKEMDKLATDMNTRFDALVILHWNRTTFTQKAREVCNQAGQKPCITCYYEGFTSLRETLQECLRQLLNRVGNDEKKP